MGWANGLTNGQPMSQASGEPIRQPMGLPMGLPIYRPNGSSICQPMGWANGLSNGQSIGLPNCQPNCSPMDPWVGKLHLPARARDITRFRLRNRDCVPSQLIFLYEFSLRKAYI